MCKKLLVLFKISQKDKSKDNKNKSNKSYLFKKKIFLMENQIISNESLLKVANKINF